MNQVKIGKFISECRKSKNLTQAQLADKLNITDKAVSKWERGIATPDSSIMIELCEILGISVNELLQGERSGDKDNNQELLLNMSKEISDKNKIIWKSMWVIMISSIIALIGGLLLAAFLIPEGPWQLVAIISIAVIFIIPCLFSLKLEVSVGAYKCKKCGHEFVPSYMKAMNSPHFGTTRYLRCPKCGKRSWAKKVIN